MEMPLSEWISVGLAVLALLVSVYAVRQSRRLQRENRVEDLLSDSHREIEKAAAEATYTINTEFLEIYPDHHYPGHETIHRLYVGARRTHARVAPHLPRSTRRDLDRRICEFETIRESPGRKGAELIAAETRFIDALERALDAAAHPGLELGAPPPTPSLPDSG